MAKQKSGSKWITIIVLALIVVIAAAITISEKNGGSFPTWDDIYSTVDTDSAKPQRRLTVHFIDVGQGDCIFVQTPDGENMIIDGGEKGNEDVIIPYLQSKGVETLHYVVATHPHSDHIGSLDNVIDAFTVQNVVMPRLSKNNTPTTKVYKDFLTSVKKSGAKVTAATVGLTFSVGEATCTVLSPKEQSDDMNNMSVVLRLDYGENSFLFTGDAETPVEKQMMQGEYASYLDVDVLKLGHHGSSTSSGKTFLNAASPAYCVISCGVGNDYGHPHKETMDKLSKMNTTVLRTDEMGTVRVFSDGHKISWESDNG